MGCNCTSPKTPGKKQTPAWNDEDTRMWEEFEKLEKQGKIKWIPAEDLD